MVDRELIFIKKDNIWRYKVSSVGFTVYGYGKTQEEAIVNFEKNVNEMWER